MTRDLKLIWSQELLQDSNRAIGSLGFGPSSTDFPSHSQEAGRKVLKLGMNQHLHEVPGLQGKDFINYATALSPSGFSILSSALFNLLGWPNYVDTIFEIYWFANTVSHPCILCYSGGFGFNLLVFCLYSFHLCSSSIYACSFLFILSLIWVLERYLLHKEFCTVPTCSII